MKFVKTWLVYLISILLFLSQNTSFAATDPYPSIPTGGEIPGTRVWSTTETSWPAFYDNTIKAGWKCPVIETPNGDPYSWDGNGFDSAQNKWFRVCNKNPWKQPRDPVAWDNYQTILRNAQAKAEAESRAWNAANPGKQKCVQWGPITDPDGGTSSGGVCANPVEPGPNTTVQSQAAESVVGPSSSSSTTSTSSENVSTTSSTSSSSSSSNSSTAPAGSTVNPNVPGNGSPFTKVLSGQLSTSECPVGFQGANGIIAAIGIGTFTECWPKNAWDAWRLGGTYWELFKSSGGTYDIQAVITRLAEIANYKAQAKAIAQRAADLTPGIQRCSTWSAYGETGQECAYTFVAPSGNTPSISSGNSDSSTTTSVASSSGSPSVSGSSDSSTTLISSDTSSTTSDTNTVTTARAISLASSSTASNASTTSAVTLQTVAVAGSTSEIKGLVEKIEPSKKDVAAITDLMKRLESTKVVTRTQKQVNLPKTSAIEESAKSLTPEICSVSGMSVNSLKKGLCSIEYTVVDSLGNSYSTTKTLEFKK